MSTITLTDISSHPTVGSWVWGNQGITYQVTRRHRHNGQYWLTLATDSGPVEMPLDRVVGWAPIFPPPGKWAKPLSHVVGGVVPNPSPIGVPLHPGDRVRYIGKTPSLAQVTWGRDWFEVMTVVVEMVAFRHRDWWVPRECPATDLVKISEES
jgi:hypothetical protein